VPVTVGDQAPDFTLLNQDGAPVNLKELWARAGVVLYFYPKDETLGCTAEACLFRDQYELFKEAGAEVVGVSSDTVESHKSFAQHHRLPFLLLSDPGAKIRRLYGVSANLLGLVPGRVTYIIDQSGIVRHVFNSQIRAKKHVREALEALKK
jgi:thioredoxin-dependent peroxiredoxin